MGKKNNIRSIRFSDETMEMIERQVGNNFTEKFENLVTRCMWELPAQERKLEAIRKEIQKEQGRLMRLQKASEELRWLERDLQSARHYFGIVERRAKAIAETSEEL